jgi:hypothetical protein
MDWDKSCVHLERALSKHENALYEMPTGLRCRRWPGARHGNVLISERGSADGARLLLQALVLRLATAVGPGTVRFALADPVGRPITGCCGRDSTFRQA